jgi:signal transduction histidine kinase
MQALEEARKERDTLSRDLHDGAIQSLYALQLGLSRVIDDASSSVPKIAARLEDHQQGITGVIGELREYIISHERSPESSRCDLARALTGQVERLRKLGASEFLLKIQADAAQALTSEQAIQLASIAREALSNSMRHGAPRKLTLQLDRNENTVIFRLEDDGAGFDPQEASSRGMGLVNMQTRAQAISAKLQIVSKPGQGTTVELQVPIITAA